MENITFTKIEKHPLKKCYMLTVICSGIPPFFGTLTECKNAQKFAEKKAKAEFNKMPENAQRDFLAYRKKHYNF